MRAPQKTVPPTNDERRFATMAEAAERLRISTDTMRRRIADQTFTGYRIGPRRILVDLDEVEAALRVIPTAGASR